MKVATSTRRERLIGLAELAAAGLVGAGERFVSAELTFAVTEESRLRLITAEPAPDEPEPDNG